MIFKITTLFLSILLSYTIFHMIAIPIENIFYLLSLANKLKVYKFGIGKMLKGTYLALRKIVHF